MSFNMKELPAILIRAVILAVIIFTLVHYVPSVDVSLFHEIVIAVGTIILYALAEIFGIFSRDVLCKCENE